MMDFNGIENLIKAMSESSLSSMDIEYNGMVIKMKKENNIVYKEEFGQKEYKLESDTLPEKIFTEINNKREEEELVDDNYKEIVSPIVGTFYQSSGIGKEPYVKVGHKVKKGDIVCIVEAMKVMNEIESEIDGEVVEILVQNEKMVQYGEVLFRIKPL